jgi:hypothetical protein
MLQGSNVSGMLWGAIGTIAAVREQQAADNVSYMYINNSGFIWK